MRTYWVRAILVLIAVWICAGVVIFFVRSSQPTPESVVSFIGENPLEGESEARRMEIITKTAEQINRLDFDQRQTLRKSSVDISFFRQMTPSERSVFLEATLPEGFRQLMLALNKMKPEKRKRIVRRALDDLERENPEMTGRIDSEDLQKVIGEGLGAFYEEASADVKLEFAPVLEKLQRTTQGLR